MIKTRCLVLVIVTFLGDKITKMREKSIISKKISKLLK